VDDRGRGAAVRGEQVKDRFEVVDRVQVDLDEVTVLAGDPVALGDVRFSLMLALLPVFATIIRAIVLRQLPTVQDVAGITLVVLGVALHQEGNERK